MDNQIIIDGVDVSKCEFYMHYDYGKFSHGCSLHKDMFGLPVCCDIADCCKDCYFKQLARKTQECEQIKEKYEALKLENQEGYEIVAELKHECEKLKKQLETSEKWRIAAESLNEKLDLKNTRYRKALDEIEKYINNQGINNKWNMRIQRFRMGILDIIHKAKGGEDERF